MTSWTARFQRLALPFTFAATAVAASGCSTERGALATRASAAATSDARATEDRPDARGTPIAGLPEARADRPTSLAREAEEIARGPSITAIDGYMRILDRPDKRSQMIGLVRAGQSVPLASPTALTADPQGRPLPSCDGGWYAVAPRGYACAGESSTLDPHDRRAVAAREVLPDVARPIPFDVGLAVGSPQYMRVPSDAEQHAKETGLDAYLRGLTKTSPLGPIDLSRAGHGPSDAFRDYVSFLEPPLTGDKAFAGRRVAWSREFDAEGRTWLETPDLGLIPKDKVKTTVASSLDGIDLRARPEMALPLAYTLEETPELELRTPSLPGRSTLKETGGTYARHAFIPIEGERMYVGGRAYWKTRDGHYVSASKSTTFTKRTRLPYTVPKSGKWVDVRVLGGALVAYEGTEPVYAAAISPGRDGVTVRPRSHTTLPGLYQVQWKLFTADMRGREGATEWAVDEVPFVAYFYESLALHGAYWHDEFGRPRSHGCVNLSPKSAQWLFNWMDPEVPRGWYAVAGFGKGVPITVVDVHP